MRSSEQVRERLLRRSADFFRRPDMFAADGRSAQRLALTWLEDLAFVDDRDEVQARTGEMLHRYGQCGVIGPFEAMFGNERGYVGEVASVLAQQFHEAGYLDLDSRLTVAEWDQLEQLVRSRIEESDWTQDQVAAALAPPSCKVGHLVWCFTSEDSSRGWIFFDFEREHCMRYEVGAGSYRDHGRDDQPLLRDVRLPSAEFESGLVLTLYGKVRRWGTGWWIQHPSQRGTPPEGVAEQLQAVRAADPSESRRPGAPLGYRPD